MKESLIFIILMGALLFSNAKENFTLNNSNSENISLQFNIDDIQVEEKNGYHFINSLSMSETSIIGMPKLPQYSAQVLIDPMYEYEVSFNILSSYKLQNINIAPNQLIINGLEKESIDDIDSDFYNSDKQYPINNIVLSKPQIMRDIVVSNITIIPFIFNPSLNELEILEEVEIVLTKVKQIQDVRMREMPKSIVFENIYKQHIINYNSNTRDDEYQQPAVLYICASNLESNSVFQQLVQWRRERGYVVYTASLSETGSSTSSIKNYIEDAYDTFDPPPEYVSLLGDVGGTYNIPTYYEDYGHDSYGSQCEGDHPYSQLDGNDLLPEVLIGRMSIRSSSELTTVVYKILNYEKATYLDSYPNYYENAAMAGDPSTSGNSCAITKEAIKGSLEAHGFSNVSIKTSGSGWSTWMQNELSDGVLFFNYRGYLGMSGFSTSSVDNASSGWKLSFATILTCGTGSFAEDQTSMSEKFFRAGSVTNPKGSVAAIGTATWNTHTLFNNIVDLGIYDGILADNVGTAGAALASGKFALNNTYPNDPYDWISAFTHWNNLMGDAATHLWSDTPEILDVTHVDELTYGTNFLDVEVLDSRGNPVSEAQVSLLKENEIIAINLFTNQQGTVTFDLDDGNNDDYIITVTKLDCKPYQSTISFLDNNVNVNVDSDSEIIIVNNDDDIISSGETVELSIPLINFGNQSSSNIQAILTSSSDLVTIESSSISYGSLQPNNSVYGNHIISISSSAEQSEVLDLRLRINDENQNEWFYEIPLDVSGVLLNATNTGYFQPGSTSSFDINLSNSGILIASGIQGTLSTNSSQIVINDANGSWSDLNPGQSLNSSNGFNISVSNDIINGSQFILDLLLENSEGYSRVKSYTITVGTLSDDDPMGPDQYGYYIYDSGDNNYELAPTYDWIEIDQIGTNLNLSNSGNGNWSGNGPIGHIDMPFTFKFYGIEYDEITICTNGWISPGYSTAESFRNYPIPGAGGPTPMIAAFWDDLETGNSGDVYVYSTNQYVIVEWHNMKTNWGNDNNTFQIIIYNDSSQPNGDNSIKIQYQDFNNTSSGSFSSYPPIHGSYATIGIENHLSDDGLQYSYYNNYSQAAMSLSDQTALYITTQPPIALPSPDLLYQINNTEFELAVNTSDYSILNIENVGEEGSLLTYSVSKSYPDLESPFDNGSTADSFGYFWSTSELSNNIEYNWIESNGNSNDVTFTSNDASTSMIDIGFEFPFYGETYSEFRINANGWVGFGEDNSEWYNGNIPSSDAPRPSIFGFWDDLNPVNDNCNSTCAGNISYLSESDRLIVWFDNVAHWSSEGFEDSYYTFQIILHSSGDIDININSIIGNYSATVGMQNAAGTIASQVDVYNGDYFEDNMSIQFRKPFIPTDWILLSASDGGGLYGDLYNGESDQINIEINANDLIPDEYLATIIISISDQQNTEIPILLTVLDEFGLIGDLNADSEINIQDIILLVSIILSSGEYLSNGDLNQDFVLDVVDIVQLVNLILESN